MFVATTEKLYNFNRYRNLSIVFHEIRKWKLFNDFQKNEWENKSFASRKGIGIIPKQMLQRLPTTFAQEKLVMFQKK